MNNDSDGGLQAHWTKTKASNKSQEYGFSSNQVGISAEDEDSDSSDDALCDCEDEHTCGENFSCPICKEGGNWDDVDLMDHVAKIHDIDMLNEEFSWKAARKNFHRNFLLRKKKRSILDHLHLIHLQTTHPLHQFLKEKHG